MLRTMANRSTSHLVFRFRIPEVPGTHMEAYHGVIEEEREGESGYSLCEQVMLLVEGIKTRESQTALFFWHFDIESRECELRPHIQCNGEFALF
jgi:hypothetical protein